MPKSDLRRDRKGGPGPAVAREGKARRSRATVAELAQERDFIATVLETTRALIAVVAADGRILRFNRACEEASGYREDEVRGKGFWELGLVPDDELERVQAQAEAALASDGPVHVENHWRHRDGSERLLRWSNVAVRDAEGAPRYIVGTAVDVTTERAAREQLREERDVLDLLLETTPAIVVVVDPQGRIVRFNRAAEQASGRRLEELHGRRATDLLVAPGDRAAAGALLDSVLAGGDPLSAELAWVHRDGSQRLIAWNVAGVAEPAGAVSFVVGAGIDVTERREAEALARERLDEIAHLHRVHTAGELAVLIAHELSQPLAAIAAYSDAGERAAVSAPQAEVKLASLFRRVGEQAQRAGTVVANLRRFMGKAASSAEVDPVAQLRGAVELVLPYARARRVRVDVDAPAIGTLLTDPVKLEHALVNVLRNGIEAAAEAGRGPGRVVVRLREDAGRARITVEDSGPGVRRDQIDRLFEPFHTTKAGGLGMGLRVTRGLMEALGGSVEVEPREPGGIFHLVLPLAR